MSKTKTTQLGSILSAIELHEDWDVALVAAAEPLAAIQLAECGLTIGQSEGLDKRIRAIVDAGRLARGDGSMEDEDKKLNAISGYLNTMPPAQLEATGLDDVDASALAWSFATSYGDAAFYLGVAVGLRFMGGAR